MEVHFREFLNCAVREVEWRIQYLSDYQLLNNSAT